MYCPKCGAKLAREAVFCHKCGSKMPEELLETNSSETVKGEDYDTLFSYPIEIKEKEDSKPTEKAEKAVSKFLKLDPNAGDEAPIKGEINFDIPDDWEAVPEKKPVTKEAAQNAVGGDLNFDIPDDWESLDNDNIDVFSDDAPGEYSEDVLSFEIPEDWNI